jgi:hypothetical protein
MKLLSRVAGVALAFVFSAGAEEGDFDTFGDYVIRSQTKITGNGKVVRIPIKPLKLSVSTDGVTIRLTTDARSDAWSTFTIYRSDGIGQQSAPGGPLEVVPGVQATSDHGGVHKHLRLTRDSLTLTVFPGVSDQTVITHAVHVPPAPEEPPAEEPPAAEPLDELPAP